MNELIIIEGIPGSGKTTFAKMLYQKLSEVTDNAHLYIEGDLHPADTAWCACLTIDEYQDICHQYPSYVKSFEQNKSEWNEYVILAYTKINNLDEELASYLKGKEIYDGRVGKERFLELHKSRWEKFSQESTGVNIFECSLLQNCINELLLFQCMSEDAIFKYICSIADFISGLNPIVIYLNIETEMSIGRATNERVDDDGNRVWESRIIEYISNSPYGIKHGLTGVQGMHSYFKKRKQLELKTLKELPLDWRIIQMNFDNQHDIEEQLIKEISKQYRRH